MTISLGFSDEIRFFLWEVVGGIYWDLEWDVMACYGQVTMIPMIRNSMIIIIDWDLESTIKQSSNSHQTAALRH